MIRAHSRRFQQPSFVLYAVALALLTTWPSVAQDAEDTASPAITAEDRRAVVERIAELLDERYVFPEVAERSGAHLRSELAAGRFDRAADAESFAVALTEAVQSVSNDKHMRVRVRPPARVEVERTNPMRAQAERLADMRRQNFGFERVERLDGNIGYLDLRYFAGTPLARDTAASAMAFLANVDALIFDMRRNGGGSPQMIRFLSSYLFAEPTHLNSLYWRQGDRTDEFWTLEEIPGQRMADVPVFVLTSDYTFSGAEEFSYNLRTRERATLIGETTGGGANPGGVVSIDERFAIFIPTGRAINPITGTNWEGVGVEPHIATDADEAYDIALSKAREAATARREALDRAAAERWEGFEAAQARADSLVDEQPEAAGKVLSEAIGQALSAGLLNEQDVNMLGYGYLQRQQGPLAIAAFEANVVAFPESANVYDSLGEAFMESGEKALAIQHYERSLALDPGNRNAVTMLARLGATTEDD